MALIAVVTPADKSSPTVEALSEELAGFGYDVQDEPIFKVYSATDYANGIQDAAQAAKDNLEQPSISHPAGGVLVAAGEMTATILQGMTTTSPIIMAFGGMQPDASKHHTNMAGLVGDCVHVAQHHLQQLKGSGRAVTVMYDPEHPGDATKPKNNVTNKAIGTLNGYTALPILPSDLQDGTVDTATLIGKLTDPLGAGRTQGFMMVPNAAYFECAGLIADAIDNAGNITMAYYPEFYYYTNITTKTNPRFTVSTFRLLIG